MAQEGVEPSASLVLSESGLPVAYRAKTSSEGWNRTSGLHVQSVASLPAATAPESSIREGGFEPPPPDSKSGSLPVSRFPRAPRGSRTRLSGLEDRCLCRSARDASRQTISKAEGGGVEPPRLIARPCSRRLPSPVGLPFRFCKEKHRGQESNLRIPP